MFDIIIDIVDYNIYDIIGQAGPLMYLDQIFHDRPISLSLLSLSMVVLNSRGLVRNRMASQKIRTLKINLAIGFI